MMLLAKHIFKEQLGRGGAVRSSGFVSYFPHAQRTRNTDYGLAAQGLPSVISQGNYPYIEVVPVRDDQFLK
jgi:hypothetical protein